MGNLKAFVLSFLWGLAETAEFQSESHAGLFSEPCPEWQPGQQHAQPSLAALRPRARLGWPLAVCRLAWGRAKGGALLPPGAAVGTGVRNTGALSRQSLSPTCPVGWREGKKRHAIVKAVAKAERQRQQTRAYERQTVDRFRDISSNKRSY